MTKADKVSWRTLMRRANAADKKGHKAAAKRLRTQASSLRRAERGGVKKAAAIVGAGEAGPRGSGIVIPTRDEAKSWGWQIQEAPGHHGVIVGGKDMVDAQRITAMAKRKGGVDNVEQELAQLYRVAKYQGERDADERHMKAVKNIHEAATDKIVCSAIAVFEHQMKVGKGLPPTVVLSSYTLCRMLDALNRAGYTANGKNQ